MPGAVCVCGLADATCSAGVQANQCVCHVIYFSRLSLCLSKFKKCFLACQKTKSGSVMSSLPGHIDHKQLGTLLYLTLKRGPHLRYMQPSTAEGSLGDSRQEVANWATIYFPIRR